MANAACFVCFFGVDLPHLVAEQMCVVFGGYTYVPMYLCQIYRHVKILLVPSLTIISEEGRRDHGDLIS